MKLILAIGDVEMSVKEMLTALELKREKKFHKPLFESCNQ